ncbi:MAG: hypothetical protein SGJ20_16920 [Planctomycetota bacterium]|nr:hypothetical protein [Planctomycetota bacterium]
MPRAIKEFDDRDLFIGGGLHVDEAGDTWIEMKGRISVFELLNRD